ncbi:MAG: hypothetical protein QOC69_7283, partial [Mycobacterium sp.]|jgi:hypothetical protein|nr:hypothetical protein [Mycobacterium sp.]
VKPQQVMAGALDPANQLHRWNLGQDAQLSIPLMENSLVTHTESIVGDHQALELGGFVEIRRRLRAGSR